MSVETKSARQPKVFAAVDVDAILSISGGKRNGDYYVIKCPFHNDSNPSCSIKVKPPYLGCFKCWSCGAKGGFTKLAEQLGIDTRAKATPDLYPENYEEMFVAGDTDPDDYVPDVRPLTDARAAKLGILDNGWRSFDVTFLRDVVKAGVADGRTLYFPVLVKGDEAGYIRAMLKKVAKKPSYLNKKGLWSKTKGLFLFDQAMEIARETKTVILTEGPRDSMRLMRDRNLPAISILGTNSWSESKARLLAMSGIETVILCMDGDDSGMKASLDIAASLEGYVAVKDFGLYEWEGEYDPCNMPTKLLSKLSRLYESVSA